MSDIMGNGMPVFGNNDLAEQVRMFSFAGFICNRERNTKFRGVGLDPVLGCGDSVRESVKSDLGLAVELLVLEAGFVSLRFVNHRSPKQHPRIRKGVNQPPHLSRQAHNQTNSH